MVTSPVPLRQKIHWLNKLILIHRPMKRVILQRQLERHIHEIHHLAATARIINEQHHQPVVMLHHM